MRTWTSYGRVLLFRGLFFFLITPAYGETSYGFDDSLILGSGLAGGRIERFNRADQIDPGSYLVDLYLNNNYLTRTEVVFRAQGEKIEPCFNELFLQRNINARPVDERSSASTPECVVLNDRLPGTSFKLDTARLRLELTVPQGLLNVKPRGYIGPQEWDSGSAVAFVNYDANIYDSSYQTAGGGNSKYGYLGIQGGGNLGLWRFRHQSSLSYSTSTSSSHGRWNSIRTYVQRPIPDWGSELTIGETYTEGSLFSSIGYRGFRLASDDRMLPDSQRQYAPQVRGTANSNARVVISQGGQKIHEVNVTPGQFLIDDLYGTSYDGDLDVQVIEADGSVSQFTVPYASVVDSIRPGLSRYSATLGQLMQDGKAGQNFSDFTYQRGLSNELSANVGARASQNYLAVLAGGVLATPIGAFGLNSTLSDARIESNKHTQGWRLGLNYSRNFRSTDTTLTLAGYRYSSNGYRDISDAIGARQAARHGEQWDSRSFSQRNQMTLMVNQTLGSYGSLYLSASQSDYYDGKSRDLQMQLGYSNTWRRLSYNLSYSRQRATWYRDNSDLRDWDMSEKQFSDRNSNKNNTLTLSISIPLGGSRNSSTLNSMITRHSGDTSGSNVQTGLSGTLGQARKMSYSVATARDSDRVGMNWNGNLQNQTSVGTFKAGYSESSSYRQWNGGLRGAAVVHGGGLTLGPYVGETFALVQAKGASGSEIRGGQGAIVGGNGYGLMPSLSPYRYNSVSLDPKGLGKNAELLETERKVAPYSGAAVLVSFKTLTGHALLINATLADGSSLPLGADVEDVDGVNVGMVGQGGNLYARASGDNGTLLVKWGEKPEEKCLLPFDTSNNSGGTNQALIHLESICTPIQEPR